MPPLRKRKDDLHIFCELFLHDLGENHFLSHEVMRFFYEYNWPGNIRELRNVIEHAVALAAADSLKVSTVRHLPSYLYEIFSHKTKRSINVEQSNDLFLEGPFSEVIEEIEIKMLKAALEKCRNKKEAINMLGISSRTFYHKLKKYNITQ